MTTIRKRQKVSIYHGPRGACKTLSMSIAGVLELIQGGNVWSNYPIIFDYARLDGTVETLRSTVIDVGDLLEIQRRDEIRNGRVLLDEWNLFINSRRSGAVANQIFTGVAQLIRKRQLSFDITCQDPDTLDKNIRWQCDLGIQCYDMAYTYDNLPDGHVIRQTITDLSGLMTGRIFARGDVEGRERNTRVRLLVKAGRFHNSYDTDLEYDVLTAYANKYEIPKVRNVIGVQESEGFERRLIDEYRDTLLGTGLRRVRVEDVQTALVDMGMDNELRGETGKKLRESGFRYKQTRQGNYYELDTQGVVC